MEENADASEWPISDLSGAPTLGRLWVHIIYFSCYFHFNIKNKSQHQCLGVGLICYRLSVRMLQLGQTEMQ